MVDNNDLRFQNDEFLSEAQKQNCSEYLPESDDSLKLYYEEPVLFWR